MSFAVQESSNAVYHPITAPKDDSIPVCQYSVLKHIFVEGIFKKMPDAHDRATLRDLERVDFVVEDEGEYRLTVTGVNTFIKWYIAKTVGMRVDEEDVVNFFKINYSERLADGKLDDPLFMCSNNGMLNFVQLLLQEKHLSISDASCAYDYAVVEFIDEGTGNTYLLFPGDAVVNTESGYTVHSFRTE